jgi:hypothetical protein
MMINSIEEYLRQLKKELAGCDRATVQDALSDSEEYLRYALENKKANQPEISEETAILSFIEEYGTPAEVGEAYRKAEAHSSPSLIAEAYRKTDKKGGTGELKQQQTHISVWKRFFGVVIDPRAWGALLYQ